MRPLSLVCPLLAAVSLAACMDPAADEDAAADAAPSGKSDASGFRTGTFASDSGGGELDEPILAVFHEDGQFDLTMMNEDYETEYTQGTYKVYRYAQKDRVRLTTNDGRVVLRTDWAAPADGSLELGEFSFYQKRRLPEYLMDCVAMLVHDTSLLEEGFTEYEYPDVSVTKVGSSYELGLGAGNYDATDTQFTVQNTADEFNLTAKLEFGGEVTMRVDNKAPHRGEIRYREDASVELGLMASLVCY